MLGQAYHSMSIGSARVYRVIGSVSSLFGQGCLSMSIGSIRVHSVIGSVRVYRVIVVLITFGIAS